MAEADVTAAGPTEGRSGGHSEEREKRISRVNPSRFRIENDPEERLYVSRALGALFCGFYGGGVGVTARFDEGRGLSVGARSKSSLA